MVFYKQINSRHYHSDSSVVFSVGYSSKVMESVQEMNTAQAEREQAPTAFILGFILGIVVVLLANLIF